MVDALRTAFRLWPGSSLQAAIKSKWLPHFVFPSPSVPALSSSSSSSSSATHIPSKQRVENAGRRNVLSSSNKTLYGVTTNGLQKYKTAETGTKMGTNMGTKTSFERIARAMLAYFGAGTAVVVTTEICGKSTAYASERPNSTSWSASKHGMAVADVRVLWQRAVTKGILQQQEDVTRGHRLSYSPSPSPFSCQMLPLEMPLARANYRQFFWSGQDEIKKHAIQGNNWACIENRTVGAGSELQWELSPSSMDQSSRNLFSPRNDAVVSNLRKNDSCGLKRSEGDICRREISVEDNESMQGEGDKLEGCNFSNVNVPSFKPSVQRRLTTKIAGSEWELTVSSNYIPENSSSGSSTSYSASGTEREGERGFHPYAAGKSTEQWNGSGGNHSKNPSRLLGSQNDDLPQVFSGESGYQHQETVSGYEFRSQTAGLVDREERQDDLNACFHKNLNDSQRHQQCLPDSHVDLCSENTSGLNIRSHIEADWEDQWEVSLVPEESAIFLEKPGQGEISRLFEQISRGDEDAKESRGNVEKESDSLSVTIVTECELHDNMVSSSHFKPPGSISHKEKSQNIPEKCRFPENALLENPMCENFESVARNLSITPAIVKEHSRGSGNHASEYNENYNVNKTFIPSEENSLHSNSLTATRKSILRSSSQDPCSIYGNNSNFLTRRESRENPIELTSKPSTSYALTEETEILGPQKSSEILNLNSIGEALCHSQTRARHAEEGILNEQAENKRLISLLLRECAISYSCRQWALVLQAENMQSLRCMICGSVPCCTPKKGFLETKMEPKSRKNGLRCTYCSIDHCCQSCIPTLEENDHTWEIELGCFGLPFLLGISFAGAAVYVCWKWGWITLPV